MEVANTELDYVITAEQKKIEAACEIRASNASFVPFIQMMAKKGGVEKQEGGGMLIHSTHCEQKPAQIPVRPLPDFLW